MYTLSCTVPHCILLDSTELCSTFGISMSRISDILYYSVLYCTELYLCYTILRHTSAVKVYCTMLQCTKLQCTELQFSRSSLHCSTVQYSTVQFRLVKVQYTTVVQKYAVLHCTEQHFISLYFYNILLFFDCIVLQRTSSTLYNTVVHWLPPYFTVQYSRNTQQYNTVEEQQYVEVQRSTIQYREV